MLVIQAPNYSYAQDNSSSEDAYFTVRGSVREKSSYEPIANASVQINGGTYLTTGYDGTFKIRVKIGDQLMISHQDFQTVFHTIESDDRILIQVEEENSKLTSKEKRRLEIQAFNQLIDSADTYLTKDAERSNQFIVDALNKSLSQSQNAEAYQTLGDLYMFWKQYDLAVANYKISLQNVDNSETRLKLAKAHNANNNPSEAIKTYNAINFSNLSNYQQTVYYEGLGDAQLKNKQTTTAISNYKKGLKVASDYLIQPKITDLNSKIAQAYNVEGNPEEAKKFFNNSMRMAKKVSPKRAIEEQATVAEFNSDNKAYDDEIEIRKEVVEAVKGIEKDSIISNDSPITPQKQNYKIGNALILQKNYNEAISFLDESISEADKREDLEVKNDALRRKADALENLGKYDEAKKTFQEFMASVDQLYLKKQQEIARSARLARSIAESQNRILSLENDRALSKSRYELTEAQNKTQQIIIYALIGGLVLLLIAAYFTYKYIKQQRLANNLLALKSLRSQMNPHFIFNALNSVNSFIASSDERTANKYLSDFSFLMRAVLENSEEDFIPLKKEIELLQLYTKLEHFRFKEKFDYTIEVDENIDVEDYEIPPMLLQPYIENAVWHGLRYKTEKGHLKIEISPKSDNEITISIVDDGVGRQRSQAMKTENQKKHRSKGLSNIKKRIQILNDMYKDKIDVVIDDYQNAEDAGTRVEVTLKKD
ncbi:tetratricopeptide repeat protein [Winogradskyella wandonensis]|uniref:Tetratricopeptide repeat protein n=2 Tax=Winogradskyella wandonensis TaxID=1442586 RepID=A0A4R1KRB1_9FLAO|nr:tetratricopeptide repeat protein [Winogradskyella wandonensis]